MQTTNQPTTRAHYLFIIGSLTLGLLSTSAYSATCSSSDFKREHAEREQFKRLLEKHCIKINFMPAQLATPAMSLQRLSEITNTTLCNMTGANQCSLESPDLMTKHMPILVAISEGGDRFFCNPSVSRDEIIVFNSQEKENYQKDKEMESVLLPENWLLLPSHEGSFASIIHYCQNWQNFSFIPVIRTINQRSQQRTEREAPAELELGVFDVNSRSITPVALIQADEKVHAAHQKAALISNAQRVGNTGFSQKFYLARKNTRMPLARYKAKVPMLDLDEGTVISRNHDQEKNEYAVTNIDNPLDKVSLPRDLKQNDDLQHCSLQRYKNNMLLACTLINNESTIKNSPFQRKLLQLWHYGKNTKKWELMHNKSIEDCYEPCVPQMIINNSRTLATGIWNQCDLNYSPLIRLAPDVVAIALGTNKSVTDIQMDDIPYAMVTSRNGRYIAAQSRMGNVFTWKVRGINLPASCTFADRSKLHELDELYRKGKSEGVIHLDTSLWEAFQALSQRPECEVPHDWQRLFTSTTIVSQEA